MEKIKSFDGHIIQYEMTGQGRPLVLLHGMGMSQEVWRSQKKGLSDDFTVITLDLRGHGCSKNDTTDFSISAQAKDLRELLSQLALKNVFLLGWSLGAAVAFRYLQDFNKEKQVGKLGLVGAGIDYRMPGPQQKEFQQWISLLMSDNENWPKLFAESCLSGAQPPETSRFLEKIIRKTGNAAIAESARCLAKECFTDLLPNLDLPVLVCCGRHETQRAVTAAQALAKTLSRSRLVFFEKSGHSPFLQEPEKFNREIINFSFKPI